MPRIKGKAILVMLMENGEEMSIRVTGHAWEQMESRKISVGTVGRVISALGDERLLQLQSVGLDVAVVHKTEGIAIVFGWDGNKIMVVTVLPESDIFVKRGTLKVNLY